MRDKQLKNEFRYYGIDSETGHRWYNFDPITILECGRNCTNDNDMAYDKAEWSLIGELLDTVVY